MRICLDGRMSAEGAVVALGMFDGVHIGHQVLLKKAKAVAERADAPVVVQTFAQHPLSLLAPEQCPPLLTTLEERVQIMAHFGVDVLCAPPFTEPMRDMPPEEFVGRLVSQWKPVAVVVGFNYTFGAKGAGNSAWLEALGNALGFETYVVPAIRLDGQVVSATRIRDSLSRRDPGQAWRMLGRPYAREMLLATRAGERCTLHAKPDGKLELPGGLYRTLLTADGARYPSLLRADGNGGAIVRLPENVATGSDVKVEYIAAAQERGV